MVKAHHVPNHIYTDFHIINFTIVISQRPNASLIIIMNTAVRILTQHANLWATCIYLCIRGKRKMNFPKPFFWFVLITYKLPSKTLERDLEEW